MFCYNCGTKLPDEAKFCISCGTKLAFDNNIPSDNKSGNNRNSVDLVPAKAVPVKKALGKKYKIGNYTITFGENESRYIECHCLLREHWERNDFQCQKIIQNEITCFDDIGTIFIDKLEAFMYDMVDVGVETLMDNSIDYVDHATLEKKLLEYRPFEKGLKDLVTAVQDIQNYEQQLGIEYSNRSRFEGGGFGISGAIKGAVQAKMLNIGMDALTGLGKWITGNTDNDKIRRRKAEWFDKLHNQDNFELTAFRYFCDGVQPIVDGILIKKGIIGIPNFNQQRADAKLNNLDIAVRQNRYTLEQIQNSLLEGLLMDPYNIGYYARILHAIPNSKDDLRNLAEDCGISFLFKPIIEQFEAEEKAAIAKRKYEQKLAYVKKYTSDTKILNQIENVVIGQNGLDNILSRHKNGSLTIYLTQGVYNIPLDKQNLTLVGLGKVTAQINSAVVVDFEKKKIFFQNITFDDSYKEILRLQKLIDEGIINLRAKEYEKAEQLFSESRNGGNLIASWFLGLMFRYGLGFPENPEKAESLFSEGDKKPDKKSAAIIADFCRNGELFPADYQAALQWYEKSEPNSTHLIAIAEFYEYGLGVPENKEKAVQLYHKAAEKGSHEAYYRYAMLSDISLKEKNEIFEKVARNGHPKAMYQIGILHAEYYAEVFDESPEVGVTTAFSYFRKAAEKGCTDAMYRMGLAYLDGVGVEQSDRLATDCFRKAAGNGHIEAMVELGVCYANGTGIKQNYARAIEFYIRAATLGNDEAEFNLGLCYQYGLGVPVDNKIAAEWYKKSCDNGNSDAKIALSELDFTE